MSIGWRGLRVFAREHMLLDIPELQVPTGATLAVLGPNGAGKSTLLRALGHLGPHRVEGQVLIDGRPATPSELRSAVAAVLQRPILRRGTVTANVATGLRFHGLDRREADARIRPWLAALGIEHLAHRDARSLSGGEGQRVSIARALAIRPRVLLLDEPFTGLDSATRAELLADLRAALNEQDTATILVTHDRCEAATLADRTALLVEGTIRHLGPTLDVLDQPVDLAAARLLGFTNAVRLGVTRTLVARPEDCRALPPGSGTSASTVPGRVARVLALGGTTRVDVDTAGGTVTCHHTGPAPQIRPGSAVEVALPRGHLLADGAGPPTGPGH